MIIASYARYSTDMQRPVSIEDQERKANKLALDVIGAGITLHYRDHAESGWNLKRSDYMRLLTDARAKLFQVLALDDLSRLGRDQDERGLTIRRLEFIGIRIITANGYDSAMPVQLRTMMRSTSGMIDSIYSIDLAEKTHRGLTGQALKGFNAGGRSYGYRHLPILDETRLDEYGRPRVIAARREVDESQASVVREIFALFLRGQSARAIAHELNRRRVPGPRGGIWRLSAIYGDRRTGVGILNNPLYNGDLEPQPLAARTRQRQAPAL
jgi:DNA invertase Pin-like site-specific DNA recombinase